MAGINVEDILSKLTGNDTVNQIFMYNLVGTIIAALSNPLVIDLQQTIAEHFPNSQLSPQAAATAVVRGFMSAGAGASEAALSGVDAARFQTLVDLSGVAPAPQQLAEALRRGIIPESASSGEGVGFIQGIEQGDLANKWAGMIKALDTAIPSPTAALDALLKGQTDEATARELYTRFGGDVSYFDLLFNTEGAAPTPTEAAVMANRGIIPWTGRGAGVTSYEQAFLEGQWRNKWSEPYRKIAQYYPPPRTITAMFNSGQLSHDDALKYLIEQGLEPTLAASYLQPKATSSTSKPHQLAVGTIEKLYTDQVIDANTATTMLTTIGYSAPDAQFYIEIMDLAISESQISSVIGRIRTLYINHKISQQDALNALNSLQIPGKQVNGIIQTWELARAANYVNLSAATIAGALKAGIIDATAATNALQRLGYTPYDAWMYLSEHMKAPISAPPPQGVINPGSQ